eukprot:scpid71965/ scgid1526/ Putative glucuronosyltransferase PGSIP6; Glycogenin-like protein 6; Plant glycogenin-like starch initiation protein 6
MPKCFLIAIPVHRARAAIGAMTNAAGTSSMSRSTSTRHFFWFGIAICLLLAAFTWQRNPTKLRSVFQRHQDRKTGSHSPLTSAGDTHATVTLPTACAPAGNISSPSPVRDGIGVPSITERTAFGNYYLSLSGVNGSDKLLKYTCRFTEDHSWPHTPGNPGELAIVSLLSASVPSLLLDYILGLEVLGTSLDRFAPKSVPRVLMVLEGTDCDELCMRRLHDTGWRICHAPPIKPPRPSDFARFKDQFVKLLMWNMVQYKRVVYMDADTLAVGRLERLLATPVSMASNEPLAVAQDIFNGKWVDGFNMGVAVIPTNRTEFVRLFNLLESDSVEYESTMSEQGFLSVIYKNVWTKLAFEDNANLAAWLWDKSLWQSKKSDIRLVHFTMEKGWKIDSKSKYAEIGRLWKDTRDLLFARRLTSIDTYDLAFV